MWGGKRKIDGTDFAESDEAIFGVIGALSAGPAIQGETSHVRKVSSVSGIRNFDNIPIACFKLIETSSSFRCRSFIRRKIKGQPEPARQQHSLTSAFTRFGEDARVAAIGIAESPKTFIYFRLSWLIFVVNWQFPPFRDKKVLRTYKRTFGDVHRKQFGFVVPFDNRQWKKCPNLKSD